MRQLVTSGVLALALAACSGGGAGQDTAFDAAVAEIADSAADPGVPDVNDTLFPDPGEHAGDDAAPGADVPADLDPVPWPEPIPLTVPLEGLPILPVRIDGGTAQPFVLDTGAVRTAADPALLSDVANGVGVGTFDLGDGVVLADYEVLATVPAGAIDVIGVPLKGRIGQDLFGQLWFGVDYRARQYYVSTGVPTGSPPGFEAAPRVELPYDVVQGYPVVTVRLGNTQLRLIADTGSGVTLIDETRLSPDVLGPGLAGYVWHTSHGSDEGKLVRLPDLEVGGVHLPGTWAVAVPHEHHLRELFGTMGVDVDGFLGYPVYREFFVGIRGAARTYDLWPCGEPDPLAATEWDRVGVEVRRSGDTTILDMVFAPSDADAVGLEPLDRLLRVDGVEADDLALDPLRLLLRGAPGESRTLTLLRGGMEVDVAVKVDHLLPVD